MLSPESLMPEPSPPAVLPALLPVTLRVGQRVPLRDGACLSVDCWQPEDPTPQARTAVLTLSPYGRDSCAETGRFFAARGFVYIAADCRGRGDSDGNFTVYGDGDDYADLIAWAAAQAWCNGQVVTQGGSYAGINQWQVATRRPAALRALAPMVAPMPGPWGDTLNGVVISYSIAWATLVQGRHAKWQLFADRALWRDLAWRLYRDRPPNAVWATSITAAPNPVLLPMLQDHQAAAWVHALPTATEFAHTTTPVLTLTGLYDNAQVGTLQYWRRHEAAAGAAHRNHRWLVIGPSAHAGTRTLSPQDDAQMDGVALSSAEWQDQLCADFYRWATQDGPLPALLNYRVSAFVTGLEQWAHAPDLPALSNAECLWHPAKDQLTTKPPPSGGITFANNPLDTRFAELEAAGDGGSLFDAISGEAPLDTAFADHLFGQGWVWESDALTEDLLLCGTPRLQLRLVVDTPDADLLAAVIKCRPDGRQVVLSSTLMRLRYRDGLDQPSRLWPAGHAELVRFPEMRFIATRVAAGCRLRLVLRVPASCALERQMNAATPVSLQTLADATAGQVTVLAGPDSLLALPLLNAALPRSAPAVPGSNPDAS
jgi:putative CocE/NonD family hydrolase